MTEQKHLSLDISLRTMNPFWGQQPQKPPALSIHNFVFRCPNPHDVFFQDMKQEWQQFREEVKKQTDKNPAEDELSKLQGLNKQLQVRP